MSLHHSHNLFRARAAIHAGARDIHSRCLQPLEESFQSLFLVKAHVGIALSVLNADNHVADDRNARTVAQELLVGGLCVILFRLYELMVKVKIVFLPSLQLDSTGKEQQIKVRPFILPYLSDMSKKDKELIGGVEDMRTKQGFYVYRNERLIIWGNWFGMTRRNELTKNARIRVDIPNSLDDIWSIDVKKQVAKIPKRIQNQLTKMVNDALGISVSKQTHRGRKQKVDENIDYIWDRIEGRNKNFYYKVNRDSELFKFVFSRLAEEDIEYVKMLVSEIEKNVPMQQIYLDKSNDNVIIEEDEHREDEVYQLAITMIDASKVISSSSVSELINNFMKSEPFCQYEQLNGRLKEYYHDEFK